MEFCNLCCKTLVLLTSVSLVLTANEDRCLLDINTLGAIEPSADIFLEHGSPWKIYCTVHDKRYNSLDLVYYNGDNIVSQKFISIVNETTIKLMIPNLPPSKNYYYCKIKNATFENSANVCVNIVYIDSKPQNVNNFTCLSHNWESLVCTWKCPETYVQTNYSLSYSLYDMSVKHVCPGRTEDRMICVWNISTTPQYRIAHKFYFFSMTVVNRFGKKTFITKFNNYENVIPNKPVNLSLVEATANSLEIKWTLPNAMKMFPSGVVPKIEYQTQWDSENVWHSVTIPNYPKGVKSDFTFNITGLRYAYTLYDIRVYIRSGAGVEPYLWSEPAKNTFRTTETIPKSAPKTDIGSFEINIQRIFHNEGQRDVLVYWQQIPEYYQNGANFSYRVQVAENGIKTNVTPSELTKSFAMFEGLSNNNYTFTIIPSNIVGESHDSSEIFVPAFNYSIDKPESFTKIAFDHGVYELSWKPPSRNIEEIESYTLFWCDNQKDRPFQCIGKLNWTTVPSNVTIRNITFPFDDHIYQFAISANTKSLSSGIVWAQCILHLEEAAVSGKMRNAWINKVGSNFIDVIWKLDCIYRIKDVLGFLIRYCPIVSPDNNTCKDPVQSLEVAGNSVQTTSELVHKNITGLKPYTTYKISIAVVTKRWEGLPSDPLYNTTLEAAPDEPPQNVTVLNVTSTSILLSWSAPKSLNGVLREYKVFWGTNVVTIPNGGKTWVELKGLDIFTEYNISVSACTNACTSRSPVISVMTNVGVPGIMQEPKVTYKKYNPQKLSVNWVPPLNRGGSLDYYEIKLTLMDEGKPIFEKCFNQTEQPFEIASECEIYAQRNLFYDVTIRAINVDNDKLYKGPWSPPGRGNCVHTSLPQHTVVILFVVGVICVTFILVASCVCTRCIYKKCKEMSNVQINMPSKLTEISEEKEKEGDFHSSVHVWTPIHTQESNSCDLTFPDQQLLLDRKGKEELLDRSEENEDIVGDVDQESSGCGSGHGSVSSSINGAAQVSSDSGTEADQRASSPDVFSDSPSRVCLLRQRNISGCNGVGIAGEGYCRVAPAPSSYVPLPNASRGYIMHPPPRNNGNQFAPPKGYVMAGQPLAPPVSTYCVLGWKPSEEAPHNSNHECGFSGQIQANRGYVTDSDGVSDNHSDPVSSSSSI